MSTIAKVTVKGQTTIPQEVRGVLGRLSEDDAATARAALVQLLAW